MKKEKISRIIGKIDDKYIDEAGSYDGKKAAASRGGLLKWGALAACLTAVLAAGIFAWPAISHRNTQTKEGAGDSSDTNSAVVVPDGWVLVGGVARPYKEVDFTIQELAIAWPWEYMTIDERYPLITVNGKKFLLGNEIDEGLLGDVLGNYEAEGREGDMPERVHHETFEVREIQGVSPSREVAVNMDGKYYAFFQLENDPPDTLGELLDDYGLPDIIELDRCTYQGSYLALVEDDPVWEILSACREAPIVYDRSGSDGVAYEEISFRVTSEVLGTRYPNTIIISNDGYLRIRTFEMNYFYMIGKEAAAQIIAYVSENAEKAECDFEPYSEYLAGTIVGREDGYILVDDSIRCTDASDGMLFRIPDDDLKVSRYMDSGWIEEGDVVSVQFVGNIDTEAGNVIYGFVNMHPANVSSDGGIYILE